MYYSPSVWVGGIDVEICGRVQSIVTGTTGADGTMRTGGTMNEFPACLPLLILMMGSLFTLLHQVCALICVWDA